MSNFYILAIVTALISAVFTPLVKKLAIRVNAIDIPKDDKKSSYKACPSYGRTCYIHSFCFGHNFV